MNEPRPTLEASLGRLEAIVNALEREELELEVALRLFEEGISHLRSAQGILKVAELRIERLIEERGEAFVEPMTDPTEL